MIKTLCYIVVILISSCSTKTQNKKKEENNTNKSVLHKSLNLSFNFEGSEPFWTLNIENDSVSLFIDNEYRGKIEISEKSKDGEFFGFQNKDMFGVINKTWENYCWHAVTEKDSLAYEIYFVFKSRPYRGCGEKLVN